MFIMIKVFNWLFLAVAFVYNILDVWHTKLLLATGLVEEANPIMDYFIVNYGINSCYYVKIVMFAMIAVLLPFVHRKYKCELIQGLVIGGKLSYLKKLVTMNGKGCVGKNTTKPN